MPDKKLTDKEIVKAVNHCKDISCNDCILCNDLCEIDHGGVPTFIVDLINRLQAKVEKCEKVEHFADKTIATLQAENERLLQELQYPQADTVQLMSEENIVHCKECKYLMFSDFEGECSKGYKGIVRPNDSCPFGVRERGKSK